MQPSTARCVTGTAKQVRCERLDETIRHSLRDAEQFAKKRQSSQTSTQTKKPSFPRASVTSKCLMVMSRQISLCTHTDLGRFQSGAIVTTQSGNENLQQKQQLTSPALVSTNDTKQTLSESNAHSRHRLATMCTSRGGIVLLGMRPLGARRLQPHVRSGTSSF